jgi:hypothetical protein
MTKKNRFRRGGGGVYKCEICERSTRQVDQGGDSRLCQECWDLAGLENMVSDNGRETITESFRENRDYLLHRAIKRGGVEKNIREEFKSIFENPSS